MLLQCTDKSKNLLRMNAEINPTIPHMKMCRPASAGETISVVVAIIGPLSIPYPVNRLSGVTQTGDESYTQGQSSTCAAHSIADSQSFRSNIYQWYQLIR